MLQPFLLLDDSIGSFQLGKFVYDREQRKIIRHGFEHGRLWRALEWYLLWLKEEKGVKYFCEYLYAVTLHPLSRWQMDTMDAFYEYREKMPKLIRDAVLRDGFTPEIHDAVSEEINCLTWQEKNVRIVYPAELLMLECRIDDYQFQLVPDSKNFRYIGIHMHNCIASYRQRVLEGDSAIIVVTVGEAYAACVELDANKNIIISSPAISGQKVYELISMLKEKQETGVQITIVTWTYDSYGFGDAAYWMQLHEEMRKAGFYIETVEESCERFAVIDQEVVWYGNINLLAKDKVDDSIMRVLSKEIASELMEITFGDNG